MKKNRLIFVFATLLIGVALVFSCQKEEATNEEQGLKLKNGSVCEQCVVNWMDSKVTASGWTKYNKPAEMVPSTFLDTYNDGDFIYYCVRRTSGTFDEVRVNGTLLITQLGMTTYSWKVPLAEVWKSCDKITITVELRGVSGGIGRTNVQSFDYYMREKCPGCEESFTYTNNGNNSYTFTYTPAEDVIDQTVVFTFPQAKMVLGLDESWETNGSTRQKSMSFTECEPVSWTLTFTPDCSGHSAQSNVWTDFKVNNMSKKGGLSNIVITCPEVEK